MILARFDKVVPYQNGIRLREEIGNPETIVIPTGHYSAILFLRYIKKTSLGFFRARFD